MTVFTAMLVGLAGTAYYYHDQYSEQRTANQQLQTDNDRQASVIVAQSLQFNHYNQIAAAAQQYETKITAGSQEKQIEYRTILKTEKTCDLPVPADVASGLLSYAYRLRTSAMHADPGIINSAGAGPAASGALTYCQVVLWIDPLLTAINRANSQLAGIRQIENFKISH